MRSTRSRRRHATATPAGMYFQRRGSAL
jgi:hypothetical protein